MWESPEEPVRFGRNQKSVEWVLGRVQYLDELTALSIGGAQSVELTGGLIGMTRTSTEKKTGTGRQTILSKDDKVGERMLVFIRWNPIVELWWIHVMSKNYNLAGHFAGDWGA